MKVPKDLPNPAWLAFGNHAGIIQSTLDFDYFVGRQQPSIKAVVGVQQKVCRYFFGQREVLIPGYVSLANVPQTIKDEVQLIGIMQSGRRVYQSAVQAMEQLHELTAGFIFAEGVTEQDALKLRQQARERDVLLIGPASVGMIAGGNFKLGAIAGTTPSQIAQTATTESGNIAVISTSGGIVNEIITTIAYAGGRVGYAVAIGGERYPVTTPVTIFEQALQDDTIQSIVYFGELGGSDEYEIAELYKQSANKKPAVAYIAGIISEKFDTPQQFGHAKAMAHNQSETTSAKKEALAAAGIQVAQTFGDFETAIKALGDDRPLPEVKENELMNRQSALFVDRISKEGSDGVVKILDQDLLSYTQERSLSRIILEMFMGKKDVSPELAEFFDVVLRLLVDHGPQVSGAVNTMITARAGKDLSSALAAGILTIGPRFGGAINQAATNWLTAVNDQTDPNDFVEAFAARKEYIAGIGHRKYSTDNPDPRVAFLMEKFDKGGRYTGFAKQVATITTSKKGQLILNVDGAVAALLLDILETNEGLNPAEIRDFIATEFFNAMFIIARSIGFTAHYLEQKRLDEGLFRLPDDLIISAED